MAARPRRIVVGFDGSDGSRRALDVAAQLMSYGSTMTVVSVAAGNVADRGDPLDAARDLLFGRLIQARYERRLGDPADALVEIASELEADVIVVGRGRADGSNGSTPGSVSADLVRRVRQCDVLVVGEPGEGLLVGETDAQRSTRPLSSA